MGRRPTLFIGLGGFGSSTVRKLKEEIQRVIPDKREREGYQFIALDTQPRPGGDILTQKEYIPLSLGINPDRVAESYPELNWYKKLAGKWKYGGTISGGADTIKAVGRIAFLHPPTITTFLNTLTELLDVAMEFRETFTTEIGPKVYLISTLAGGTGAGIFMDVSIVVSRTLQERYGGNFSLQAIIVTPEILEGRAPAINYPKFSSNTYATLKEIHHFIVNQEVVSYPIERFQNIPVDASYIPNTLFLITDRNAKETVLVSTLEELRDLVVKYLLSEVETPLDSASGQPRIQDQENSSRNEPGHGNMLRFLSSFGVVQFGVPFDLLLEIYSSRLLNKALKKELSRDEYPIGRGDEWIRKNRLGELEADDLQDRLGKKGDEKIQISIDFVGRLRDLEKEHLETEAMKLWKEYEAKVRELQGEIKQTGENILSESKEALEATLEEFLQKHSLGYVLDFLNDLEKSLSAHWGSLNKELDDTKAKLRHLALNVEEAVNDIGRATMGGGFLSFFGGRGKIENAISSFDEELNTYLRYVLQEIIQTVAKEVLEDLMTFVKEKKSDWNKLEKAFQEKLNFANNIFNQAITELSKMSSFKGSRHRISILNPERAEVLYEEYVSKSEDGLIQRLRESWREKNFIKDPLVTPERWTKISFDFLKKDIESLFDKLDLVKLIHRFYETRKEREEFFRRVLLTGSVLFPVNSNTMESQYHEGYVLAATEELQDELEEFIQASKKGGVGISKAYYENKWEAFLFLVSHGYTAHSLTRLESYKSFYEKKLEEKIKNDFAPPVHGWWDASSWEDLFPKTDVRAYRVFVIGKALEYLYPHKKDDKDSFIYNRANSYFFKNNYSEVKIGTGLSNAIQNLKAHKDWQDILETRIEKKKEEVGTETLIKGLEEYKGKLAEELSISYRARNKERAQIIKDLLEELENYINELRPRVI